MTRVEAVLMLWSTELAYQAEYCADEAERAESEQEFRDCLTALGCTPEEIDA